MTEISIPLECAELPVKINVKDNKYFHKMKAPIVTYICVQYLALSDTTSRMADYVMRGDMSTGGREGIGACRTESTLLMNILLNYYN